MSPSLLGALIYPFTEWEHTRATFITQLALNKKSVTPPVLEGFELGILVPGALGGEGDGSQVQEQQFPCWEQGWAAPVCNPLIHIPVEPPVSPGILHISSA